jgi:hypothetical protein
VGGIEGNILDVAIGAGLIILYLLRFLEKRAERGLAETKNEAKEIEQNGKREEAYNTAITGLTAVIGQGNDDRREDRALRAKHVEILDEMSRRLQSNAPLIRETHDKAKLIHEVVEGQSSLLKEIKEMTSTQGEQVLSKIDNVTTAIAALEKIETQRHAENLGILQEFRKALESFKTEVGENLRVDEPQIPLLEPAPV